MGLRNRLARAQKAKLDAEMEISKKQSFIRYLFHELRVPLNALVLGLDNLQMTYRLDAAAAELDEQELQDAKELNEMIGTLQEGTHHMYSIIDTVLACQKQEDQGLEAKIDYNPQLFSLVTSLESCAVMLKAWFVDKNINLELDIDKDIPEVVSEKQWFVAPR